MSKIRAVIFDCYGTLVDIHTNEGKDEVFNYLALYLQYYGATISAEELKAVVALEKDRSLKTSGERYPEVDLEKVFKTILRKERVPNSFLAESCCKLKRLLSRERFQLFPDSLPVLRELKREGYPLAMVSDAQKVYCFEEAKMLGLDQFFDNYIVSTQYGFKKPDPRLFAIACDLLEIPPAEAVYIGDNFDRDIKGPKEIGMQVILVNRDQKENTQEPGPDFYAKDLWEAWAWIKGSNKS
jgi:putative hydrolase of the HAD superfamily